MAFTSYSPTGPFTDNTTPPSLSAAYNHAIETFLQQIVASAVADSHISSDGNGNLSIPNTGHYQIGAFQVMWSPGSTDLFINCPNSGSGHKLFLQVGGVNVFSVDQNGNVRCKGTLTQNVTP